MWKNEQVGLGIKLDGYQNFKSQICAQQLAVLWDKAEVWQCYVKREMILHK